MQYRNMLVVCWNMGICRLISFPAQGQLNRVQIVFEPTARQRCRLWFGPDAIESRLLTYLRIGENLHRPSLGDLRQVRPGN